MSTDPGINAGLAKLPDLFKPGKLGPYESANRIKFGACCVSNFNSREGFISERELARTKVIAESGAGIVTNQGASPDASGEGKAYWSQIALFDDKFMPQFEQIAGYIHEAGAVAIQQLLHAGRYGGIDLGYCVQPSVVPQTLPHFRPPREMTKEDIRFCIAEHAETAERAIRAGFDGVELTSFMGYLLANFNSPFTNKRSDEYGGSTRNRCRFMTELIYSIKDKIGDEHPLVVRLNGAELMDKWGGSDEDDCFEIIATAGEHGVDMVSVTVGWQEAPESSIGRDVKPGHWNRLAARAREVLPESVPVAFGVRLPDPVDADRCIAEGEFDFWEVCRPMLADPELIHKAREDRLEEKRVCVGSLNCLSRLFRDLPYSCTVNPALGHEYEPEYRVTPTASPKTVMVVGAGPAGMECAITAAKRGHAVTVFERGPAVGGALMGYAAHDQAHGSDLMTLVEHYRVVAERLGIEVKLNTEVDPKLMRSVLHHYDVAVVAAGSRMVLDQPRAAETNGLLLDGAEVAAGRAETGQRVVVLGGGKVGLTLAESLAGQGHEVTVVEAAKRIAGDVSPTWKWRHSAWVGELGIATLTETRIVEVRPGGVAVTNGSGERFLEADSVIATERRPNQELFQSLEWMVDELHGIGDALMPRGLDQAIHEGYRLGCRI
ncbi:MAG TPA: FAD-dependent oxidoreductase [Alphaproteobacteria bacterium]|nr:FAD-dependent oxidoreductase [Alphaproteobacteria bacterium]